MRTKNFLYIINKRPHLDNGGPIDANQSASAKALKAANRDGKLTLLQKDAFVKPRPAEEFYDTYKDPQQVQNLAVDRMHHTQIQNLRKILALWKEETGDTVPSQLTPDWYDRETGEALPSKGTRGEMPGASRKA